MLTSSKPWRDSLYNLTLVLLSTALHGNTASVPSLTIMVVLEGVTSRWPVSEQINNKIKLLHLYKILIMVHVPCRVWNVWHFRAKNHTMFRKWDLPLSSAGTEKKRMYSVWPIRTNLNPWTSPQNEGRSSLQNIVDFPDSDNGQCPKYQKWQRAKLLYSCQT